MSTDTSNLVKLATGGALWTAVASIGQQLFNFFIYVLLARQLGPFEFGVVAIATIFLDILTYIGRLGLTEALVQRASLDDTSTSSAFWFSAGLGVICAAGLWASAGPIAGYFDSQSLELVVRWLAPVVLFNALGTVPEALLQRDFGFKALGIRTLVTTLVGGAVAVVMAFAHYGALSLVAQRLIAAILLSAITWHSARWLPKIKFSASDCAGLLHTGVALATSSLLAMGNQRVLDAVIGRLLGAIPLGFLRIAWRGPEAVQMLVMRPLAQISLPLFSRLQTNPARLAAAYIRLSGLTALVVLPIFSGLILVAPEFVEIVFGPQWIPSIPVMQVLLLSVLTMPLIWFKSSLLIAAGHSRLVLVLNLIEFVLSVTIVGVSCRYGLIGAAWGNVARTIVATIPILWALDRFAAVSWRGLLRSNVPAIISATLMTMVGAVLRGYLPAELRPELKVVIFGILCCAAYSAILLVFFRHSLMSAIGYLPLPVRKVLGRAGEGA